MDSAIPARIGNPWRCLRHLRFEIGDFGQSEHMDKDQEFILSVEREILLITEIATRQSQHRMCCEWNIFDMKFTSSEYSPISVNVSATGKLDLHCNAFKYLFCVLGDRATVCRADVYRFFEIPSCLDIEVDLLSSWSTGPTLRHATNFGYRIGDLPERILPLLRESG